MSNVHYLLAGGLAFLVMGGCMAYLAGEGLSLARHWHEFWPQAFIPALVGLLGGALVAFRLARRTKS